MPRTFFIACVALLAFAGFLSTTATSADAAPRVRYYKGTTSEGGRIRFSVVVRQDAPYLRTVVVVGPSSCEDGTQARIAWGFFPSDLAGPVPTNEPVELSENAGDYAYMLSGRIGPLRGSGTVAFLLPGLTADEQAAQVCTFGGEWSVERSGTSSLSLRPTMTIRSAGERTLTTGFAVAAGSNDASSLARVQTGRIRHYRGATPQDTEMVVRTSRTDTGVALLYMTVGSELACEDGTAFEGTYYVHSFFESPPVMDPGRLDVDVAPDAYPLVIATHVHGHLDAHLGSGTVSMIWPFLTEDLEAQRCQTGEQTWTLWRTDGGF